MPTVNVYGQQIMEILFSYVFYILYAAVTSCKKSEKSACQFFIKLSKTQIWVCFKPFRHPNLMQNIIKFEWAVPEQNYNLPGTNTETVKQWKGI